MQFLKDYGQETLKALFALHGGSIVAVLTFLGALLSKNEAAQLRMAAATLHAVTPGLVSSDRGFCSPSSLPDSPTLTSAHTPSFHRVQRSSTIGYKGRTFGLDLNSSAGGSCPPLTSE
jgi:hypothetical protein